LGSALSVVSRCSIFRGISKLIVIFRFLVRRPYELRHSGVERLSFLFTKNDATDQRFTLRH
jgi:hypothetical protein